MNTADNVPHSGSSTKIPFFQALCWLGSAFYSCFHKEYEEHLAAPPQLGFLQHKGDQCPALPWRSMEVHLSTSCTGFQPMSVISDEMKFTAWNNLSSIPNQTQTSFVLENESGLEAASLLQRFVID